MNLRNRYLGVVAILFIVMGLFWKCQSNKIEQRQNHIIELHKENIENVDSFIQNANKAIIDSLHASSSIKDVTDLVKSLNSHYADTETYKISDDIKAILDLEYGRIQNEYETMELWCAILTIVFLIFSFYSLFKTEDLNKRANDAVDHLKELEADADKITNDSTGTIKTALTSFQETVSNHKKQEKENYDQVNQKLVDLQEKIWSADSSIDKKIKDCKSDLDKYRDNLIDRIKKFNEEETSNRTDILNAIKERIDQLQEQIDNNRITAISSEDIDNLAAESFGNTNIVSEGDINSKGAGGSNE
jgi:hypothetical protein